MKKTKIIQKVDKVDKTVIIQNTNISCNKFNINKQIIQQPISAKKNISQPTPPFNNASPASAHNTTIKSHSLTNIFDWMM